MQKSPDKKWLQLGEKGENGKYQKYNTNQLKIHLRFILGFLSKNPEKRGE